MLIGISGKIGSGKDTVGLIIQYLVCLEKGVLADHQKDFVDFGFAPVSNARQSGWEIKKFAYKLKQIVALLTGCSVEDLENQELKNQFLPPEWEFWVQLVRHDGGQFAARTKFESEEAANAPHQNIHMSGVAQGAYTYRDFLQKVGTEAMREVIHRNVWVNSLFADYKKNYNSAHTLVDPKIFEGEDFEEDWSEAYPNWIITDTRFPNECEAIKKRGGILIRVSRPQFFRKQDLENPEYVAKHNHPSETSLDDYQFDYVINNDGSIEELIGKVREVLVKENILKA